jgi:hypothetical protein
VLAGTPLGPVDPRQLIVAKRDEAPGAGGQEDAVALRAASVEVHRKLCPGRLGRQRLEGPRVHGAKAIAAAWDERQQRGDPARDGDLDATAGMGVEQRAQRRYGGQQVTETERPQDEDPRRG